MLRETRKIQLIGEVLKIDDESTLNALEGVLKKSKKSNSGKLSIYDFVGILTEKETKQIKKAIRDTCETINKEDWK